MDTLLRRAAVLAAAVVCMLAIPAVAPASADPLISYTTRESGATECSPTQDVYTRIAANGYNRHWKDSNEWVVIPFTEFKTSTVHWEYFIMGWQLQQQVGYSNWSYTGSYAFCGAD